MKKNIKYKVLQIILLTITAVTVVNAQTIALNGANNTTIDVNLIPNADTPFQFTYSISNIDAVNSVLESQSVLEINYNDSEFKYDPTNTSGFPFGWTCNDDTINNTVSCTNSGAATCSVGCPSIQPGASLNIDIGFEALSSASAGNAATHDFFSQLKHNSVTQIDSAIKKVNIIIAGSTTDLQLKKYVKDGVLGNIINGTTINFDSHYYYSIQVNNLSATPATNVVIRDNLPVGVEYVQFFDPNSGGWTCGADNSFNINSSQRITCSTNIAIPANTANSNKYVYLEVIGRLAGAKVNEALIQSTVPNDSNSNNDTNLNTNPSMSNITIDAAPPLNVALNMTMVDSNGAAISVSDVEIGSTVMYKVLFDNIDIFGSNVLDVEITDNIPTGVSFVSINALGNFQSAQGGNGCPNIGGVITCTTPNPIPVTSSEDGFVLTVLVDGSIGSSVDNTANVTSTNANGTSSNVVSFDIVAAQTTVDLTVNKTIKNPNGNPSSYLEGEVFEYELIIFNNGPDDALTGQVEVIDVLPNTISLETTNLTSIVGWNCVANPDLIDPNRVQLKCINTNPINAGGGVLKLNFLASGSSAGTYINQANVSLSSTATSVTEISTSNNDDTVAVLITAPVQQGNLDVVKRAMVNNNPISNLTRGNSFTYEIDIHNTHASVAVSGITLSEIMPVNVQVNSINGTNWTCNTPIGQTYNCTYSAALPANERTILSFNVTDTSNTSTDLISNLVTVSADNATVPNQPVLHDLNLTSVALNFSVAPIQAGNPGDEFDIVVRLDNIGTEDLIGVVFTNTLPTGFSYSVQDVNLPCTVSGLIMTCTLTSDVLIANSEILTIKALSDETININLTNTNITEIISADNFNSNDVPVVSQDIQFLSAPVTQFTIHVNDSVDPVDLGSDYNYVVDLNNVGTTVMSFIEFDLLLPVELSQNSITPASNVSCSNTSSLVIHCISNSGFTLNPTNSVAAVSVNVQSNSFVGILTATVNALNGTTIILSDSEQTEITSTSPTIHDVSIHKTASVSDVVVNGEFQYELEITNNDTLGLATGISVTDDLSDAGVSFVSIDGGTNFSCSGTTFISCTATQLSANEKDVITITVKAPAQIGTVDNTANIETDSVDTVSSNDSSHVSVNVTSTPVVVADLSIEKTAPSEVTSGADLTWLIKIHNDGPDTASVVKIQDILPVGFEFVSVNDSSCTLVSSTVNCEIASIASGDDKTIEITGQASLSGGQLSNTVKILSTESSDPTSGNDISSAHVVVNPIVQQIADLYIRVESLNGEVMNQGDSLNFIMHARNKGPNSAVKPKIHTVISGLLKSVAVEENSDWACTINGFNIDCEFTGEQMPNGYHIPLGFSIVTEHVVQTSEDLNIAANISSTTTDNDVNNNTSIFNAELVGSPTEEEILSAMQAALEGIASQQTNRAIKNVASYCARKYFKALEGMCDDLYQAALSGEGETVNTVMEEITPNEVIGQSTSVAEIANAQFRNVGSRLAEIRGGGGSGFSASGLTATMGNGGIPLTMLSYLNKTDETTDGFTKSNNDFISPWGFFINGTISMGKRDATGRELGFDFDSYGLTAGFDYRLSSKHVLGIALGYANFDSQIDNDTASLKSTGLTLTAYGSFNITDNFYMDARISYGNPDFKQSRNINFTLGDTTIDRTAVGKTTANQYSVAMSAGYTFNKKSWNITPNGSVRYSKTRISGFTETGAGDFNFAFSNQTFDSLVWSAGIRVSKAISLKNGVITPQFDFDYNYESLNDGTNIEARFIEAPDDEIFIIETDSPDRTYGSAGLGIVYITANGKQAYINYRSTIGLEGFSRGTFNIGARFEF